MSRISDFPETPFTASSTPPRDAAAGVWTTPEGIDVEPLYEPRDRAGLDLSTNGPDFHPICAGPLSNHVRQPALDVAPVRWFLDGRGVERVLSRQSRGRPEGPLRRFRSRDHRGYDSDHPRVAGDVGMAGVAINSIYDMRTLFSGIPLYSMSVSMTMNGAVLPVLALFIVAAEEQGVPIGSLSGTIQNDILKEFMVRNTYIFPPAASMPIVADIFGFTAAHMPKFNSISISGYHMQEAGGDAGSGAPYTLADGVEYLFARRGRRRNQRR